jgi:hypothetical protein
MELVTIHNARVGLKVQLTKALQNRLGGGYLEGVIQDLNKGTGDTPRVAVKFSDKEGILYFNIGIEKSWLETSDSHLSLNPTQRSKIDALVNNLNKFVYENDSSDSI